MYVYRNTKIVGGNRAIMQVWDAYVGELSVARAHNNVFKATSLICALLLSLCIFIRTFFDGVDVVAVILDVMTFPGMDWHIAINVGGEHRM